MQSNRTECNSCRFFIDFLTIRFYHAHNNVQVSLCMCVFIGFERAAKFRSRISPLAFQLISMQFDVFNCAASTNFHLYNGDVLAFVLLSIIVRNSLKTQLF